ncbi:MAG: hypothetical protein AMK72_06620 [Planctomycetes bacterium SM23_25]|nr:MAG: hypothetical protein AMK72_06620 [Planctomycetes bacterium SM23_25]
MKTILLPTRRRARRGNALLEFVLTLPIIIFMAGVTMYMSFAMLAKQQALVLCRRSLWASAGHGHWTSMKLEGTLPGMNEDDGTKRPRGHGEELDRLREDVEPETIATTTNPRAREYWFRIWDNLPGRHESEASQSFKRSGRLWNFIKRTAHADHKRDSSPWHFYHLDAWKIARAGPLREIFEAFHEHLEMETFAPHFEPTREDIMRRWWHGDDILQEEDQYD